MKKEATAEVAVEASEKEHANAKFVARELVRQKEPAGLRRIAMFAICRVTTYGYVCYMQG